MDGDGTLLVAGRPLNGLYVWAHRGYYNSDAEVPRLYKICLLYTSVRSGRNSSTSIRSPILHEPKEAANPHNMNPDSYYAGSPLPLAHGGWVNELMWKNFDLNVQMCIRDRSCTSEVPRHPSCSTPGVPTRTNRSKVCRLPVASRHRPLHLSCLLYTSRSGDRQRL